MASETISRAVAGAFLLASLFGCSAQENKGAGAKPEAVPVATEGGHQSGKELYERYCHYCHGRKGLGDGPVGIALTPHPADFVNDAKRMSRTDAELMKSITEGIHKDIGGEAMMMPRWQDILSEKERNDVLSYIRFLEREGRKEAGR